MDRLALPVRTTLKPSIMRSPARAIVTFRGRVRTPVLAAVVLPALACVALGHAVAQDAPLPPNAPQVPAAPAPKPPAPAPAAPAPAAGQDQDRVETYREFRRVFDAGDFAGALPVAIVPAIGFDPPLPPEVEAAVRDRPVGVASKLGVYFLMVGFGAGSGYTVMSRISLLIGRFLFLIENWLGIVR